MNVKDNIYACYCNQQNLYFNISITSRELQTSRLGLISAGEANVSVSGDQRLDLELLHLVPIPASYWCMKN